MKLDIVQSFQHALFNLSIMSFLPRIAIISLTPGPCCKHNMNKLYIQYNKNIIFKLNITDF